MKKGKMNIKGVLLTAILAVAGIFGVSSAVINKQVNENSTVEKAEATTTNANNIRLFLADKKTWFSRDAYGGGGRPYARIWNISISSEADFDTTAAAIAQAGGSMNNDGSADFGMIHISGSDGEEKQWQVNLPWYITGFTYKFRSTYNNWWTSGDASVTAPCDGDGTNIWGDASSNTSCYYQSTASHTISTTTYSITFNTNGGTSVPDSPYVFKEFQKTIAPGTNHEPYIAHKVFEKWTSTNSASAAAFSFGSKLTGDITLYAQYTNDTTNNIIVWKDDSKTYAYAWFYNSVTGVDTEDAAWPGTGGSTVTIGGTTYRIITGVSSKANYVIFNNGSGSQTGNIAIDSGAFGGTKYYDVSTSSWNTLSTSIPDLTIPIVWKDQGGGSYTGSDTRDSSFHYAEDYTVTDGTKTGYTFNGWYDNSACTGSTVTSLSRYMHGSTVTLYAKWTANNYTVTLNKQSGSGGTNSVTATFDSNMPSGKSAPTRTGYTFGGYYQNTGGGGTQYYNASMASTHVWDQATNTTIYAKWTTISYTISYSGLDGATITANPTSYNIETASFTLNNPTKTGYTFKGWSGTGLDGDENKTVTISVGSTGDRTYTANWTLNQYRLTLTVGTGIDKIYYKINGADSFSYVTSSTNLDVNYNSTYYLYATAKDGYILSDAFDDYTSSSPYSNTKSTSTQTWAPTTVSGETLAIKYAKDFNDGIGGVCVYAGGTNISNLASEWGSQNTAYTALADHVKYWLGATGRSSNANIVEMIGNGSTIKGKYDYVYGKYGSDIGDDFLGRKPSPLSVIHPIGLSTLFGDNEGGLSTVIIIVSSSIALLSITALSILVIKKRKNKEE